MIDPNKHKYRVSILGPEDEFGGPRAGDIVLPPRTNRQSYDSIDDQLNSGQLYMMNVARPNILYDVDDVTDDF